MYGHFFPPSGLTFSSTRLTVKVNRTLSSQTHDVLRFSHHNWLLLCKENRHNNETVTVCDWLSYKRQSAFLKNKKQNMWWLRLELHRAHTWWSVVRHRSLQIVQLWGCDSKTTSKPVTNITNGGQMRWDESKTRAACTGTTEALKDWSFQAQHTSPLICLFVCLSHPTIHATNQLHL